MVGDGGCGGCGFGMWAQMWGFVGSRLGVWVSWLVGSFVCWYNMQFLRLVGAGCGLIGCGLSALGFEVCCG